MLRYFTMLIYLLIILSSSPQILSWTEILLVRNIDVYDLQLEKGRLTSINIDGSQISFELSTKDSVIYSSNTGNYIFYPTEEDYKLKIKNNSNVDIEYEVMIF